jgi:hypothetical protein
MQAWEKALIIAKKQESPQTKLLAFQHTVVMRNYFNYFYDKNEIPHVPLPDLLIANGKFMRSLLAESKYPNLCEAEAIRQLYLNQIIKLSHRENVTHPVLLVVGSCDKKFSTSG